MDRPLRRLLFQVLTIWLLLSGIAAYLSQTKDISALRMAQILPAFLLEAAFYLLIGAEQVRDRLVARFSAAQIAAGLWVSALLPYTTYAALTGTGSLVSFAWVTGVSTLLCGWFLWLPRRTATDLLFLLLVAGLLIYRPSSHVYTPVVPGVDVNALGRVTYIRTAILAALLLRRLKGVQAGFAPNLREWRVGVVHYLLFLPIGFLLFQVLPLGQFRVVSDNWGRVALLGVGYFLVFLWAVALWEEFFCRGYLQQVLGKGLRSEAGGWVLASVLFGLAHLWFRGFPNWHWVILATVLGLFCGHAYRRTHSIRSAMVTHALVVTTWRLFFT